MVGLKVLLNFYANGWVKGETSAECIIYHDSRAPGQEQPGSILISGSLMKLKLFMFKFILTLLNWVSTGFYSLIVI